MTMHEVIVPSASYPCSGSIGSRPSSWVSGRSNQSASGPARGPRANSRMAAAGCLDDDEVRGHEGGLPGDVGSVYSYSYCICMTTGAV